MKKSRAPAITVAVLLVGGCVAPFAISSFHTFQLTQILIYAIALLGLNLLTGYSGQISLGHGAFYGIGAYAAAILLDHAWLPYWATIPVAGAVCFAVGFGFGLPALRLEGPYLALATFALAIATPQILKHDALEKWTGGVQGILLDKPEPPGLLAGPLDADQWLYFLCLVFVVVSYVIGWNLVRGRTGRALIAIRDQPIAAAAMGIDTALYKSTTFGLSAMYTGVAGALGALLTGFVSPDSFTILVSINFLVGVVVGGMASILGNLFGALFIVIVPNIASDISESAPWAIYGALLILIMILMPRGFAGMVRAVAARRG
ncbi:MAG TPA: branched-chain amino acid ABC transporter permease [Kofleriaceae bacterium]|nr:branched-chain amino acid ABC transporter permease [Kofleriaceae bacterium]